MRQLGIAPSVVVVVVLSLIAAAVVQTRDAATAAALGSEDGPFEIVSVWAFGLALFLVLWRLLSQPSVLALSSATMLLWALLRELDLQKRYTYRSVESLGFYTRPDAPVSHKILALAALVPFVLAGSYLFLEYLRRVRPAWARGEVWVGHTFGAIGLLMVGMGLEKLFGLSAAEEVCETGMALIILLLAWELRIARPGQPEPGPLRRRDGPERSLRQKNLKRVLKNGPS